ncbi:alpha/beta hydrolase [Siccirubricoccus sp. KC 17139]|uniref:Alpha/beta hydrolase n=1 Tax=Siccirubricoccus soli TaxID=2899147 RepID=A0ABT1D0B3_9PROT|nr:alpha/beta hydrolase [Siccirubricoccus soli]MCO6415358.1 alpha/beta hydrolase [Siccirubricoccus soli]MCP2681490.1 alpha/beta hydrolase [Siccirubricoccus soli]
MLSLPTTALQALPGKLRNAPELARWGRGLQADWLLRLGDAEWLLTVRDGAIAAIAEGPFQMPAYTLATRIGAEALDRFLSPTPPPGWHDLLALRRQGALVVEGDVAAFFAHLMWFKGVLALLREAPPAPAALPPAPFGSVTEEPIRGRYLRMDIAGKPHRVYVEEAGEGIPLLLLHTAGSDGRQWRELLNDAEVTRRFRCIAFDMPWHGKSSPPAGWQHEGYALTTAAYTGLVMTMARALGLDRPIVMGCSIGGRIVLDLAAEHAGELRGVIGLQGSAFTGRYYDLSVLHHPRIHGGEVCGAMVSGLIAPTAPEASRWETLWHYMQGGPGVFRGDLHFYAEEGDLRGKLGRIDTARCPVTLLTGEYDYSCRPEDTRATAAAIPGAKAVIMPGLGHFPMSEDYAALRPYLLPALEEMAG